MILTEMFRNRYFIRKLFSLAFPITLQTLMLALVAAGDALMLGKVSQDAMAAVSLATQIQFVQNMLLGCITSGIGILGAQYWGKKDRIVLGRLFCLGVRESLFISIVFFIGCYFFPEYLMRLFASDPLLVSIGADYLRVASWSYLITGVSQSYLAVMRVSEHAARSAWISSGAVVLNILFNAVFIFGLFGIPAMGARGAAAATIVARIIELGWCVVSSHQKSFIALDLRNLFRCHWPLIHDFWRYSLPILGAYLLWGIGFTSYTALMGQMGRDAAAANAVAAVARDLMCCLCNGVAGGITILIGNELGAGKLRRGKVYGIRSLILALLTGGISMIVILAVIPLVAGSLQLTAEAHRLMVGMFVILSVYMIGRCICTILINGTFAAGGDTLFDVYSLTVFMWGIALPTAFLGAFYFHWPVLVVYACTCLDEVGKVPWVLIHFYRYKWVKNLTRDL